MYRFFVVSKNTVHNIDMNKNIYLSSGYLNVSRMFEQSNTFTFIIGARGTGKTYGFLKYCYEHRIKFIYMRRTQKEVDMISSADLNPFKKLNSDLNINVGTAKVSKDFTGFYELNEEGKPSGDYIGLSVALTTAGKLRGFDASDIEVIIYDEFIPERTEKDLFKGMEGEAFFNAYETINRNRELDGGEPIKAFLLSNSNRLDNDILIYSKLVGVVHKMNKNRQEYYANNDRGVTVYNICASPISERKQNTALYRFTSGTDFSRMAIENDFNIDDSSVKAKPLKEYKLQCVISEVGLYKHKSNGTYYASTHIVGTAPQYDLNEKGKKAFLKHYARLYFAYLNNKAFFEEYFCEMIFNRFFK